MKKLAAIALASAALAGCGSAASGGGNNTSSNAASTTASTSAPTLYTFSRDTSGMSNCNGACAQNWPPATAHAKAAGLAKAKLSTIKRADGKTQLAYGGKPLYTYVGDTKPGDANGNGLNVYGGLWTAASPHAAKPASAPARSYGY
jgi:predicted lipoprotein with Yx(FWY)xxD motif